MAGEWIKMRSDLIDDPAVFRMATMLKIDKYAVIGRLHAFWAWIDKHSIDGRVDGVVDADVDNDVVRLSGFVAALVAVNWLHIDENGICLPNFDRHNGETAKDRALKNQRQARWRAKQDAASKDVDGEASTDASTREEKRRKNKNTASSATTPKFSALEFLLDAGVDRQIAGDWLEVRKTKKLAPTKTAMDEVIAEVEKSGLALNDALKLCCARGWGGFKAKWPRDDADSGKPWDL